jgi:chorismate-pyruvate lyase
VRFWLAGLWLGAVANSFACANVPIAGSPWPDTFAVRVEALALLQTLNADLLSNDSATVTLEHWCELHKLAPTPRIVAVQIRGEPKTPTDAQRSALGVAPAEPVRYRHVRLMCGSLVLSEADNWYVPARLTPEMNHLLETTDTPFGVIVRELHFRRHTLSARLLWMPLPPGWEMNATAAEHSSGTLRVPAEVLEHCAVLTLPDGTPFSEVIETYTGNVLAFPAPQTPVEQR